MRDKTPEELQLILDMKKLTDKEKEKIKFIINKWKWFIDTPDKPLPFSLEELETTNLEEDKHEG